MSEQRWAGLDRLLARFAIARVIEARPNSLIMQVESVHTIYPEAYWHAQEQGIVAIPAGLLREAPEPGDVIRHPKGLSRELDEAWRAAHRRDLDIEPQR